MPQPNIGNGLNAWVVLAVLCFNVEAKVGSGAVLREWHGRALADQASYSATDMSEDLTASYIARYNLTEKQASELEALVWNVSKECTEVPVRVQVDYLYTMLVYAEVSAAFMALPDALDVHLLVPSSDDEVTTTSVFRSSSQYRGRGDAWLADTSTAPCKGGDCRGRRATDSNTSTAISMDDLQDLPTDFDDTAAPPDQMPGPADLPRPQLLLYYRHDLFSLNGWSPPATWADLAAWAEAVNGTVDADGDGAGDWALCLDTLPACKSGFLVMAMMASVVQPSTQYGTFFQPDTMKPLVGSVAFVETLKLFKRLAKYSVPPADPSDVLSCRPYEPGLFTGKCLVAISFDQLRAALPPYTNASTNATADSTASNTGAASSTTTSTSSSSSYVSDEALLNAGIFSPGRGLLPPDALGVAPLPGSEILLDRRNDKLLPCNATSCPNAVSMSCAAVTTTNGTPVASGGSGKGAELTSGRACLVNRAPLVVTMSYDALLANWTAVAVKSQLSRMAEAVAAGATRWGEALAASLLWGDEEALEAAMAGAAALASPPGKPPTQPKTAIARSADTTTTTAPPLPALQPLPEQQQGRRRRLARRGTRVMGGGGGGARRGLSGETLPDFMTVEQLTQLGASPTEAARFLAAYWISLLGEDPSQATSTPGPQRNVVMELSLRGSSYFTNIYSEAAYWVLYNNRSPANAANWAAADSESLLALLATNRTRLALKYSKDIGYNGQDDDGSSPSPSISSGMSERSLVGVIVGLLCAVCLAAVAVAWAMVVVRRKRWELGKAVGPPGPSLDTTLILTDIQNSTVLWETLPADVMDVALRCHHEVLRGLLAAHRGYESATEGDAFILAFHKAEDAAAYAVAAQEKLVAAPWPVELLSHPDCEVLWMAPQRSDPMACLSYVNRDLLTRAAQNVTAPHGPPDQGASSECVAAAAVGSSGPGGRLLAWLRGGVGPRWGSKGADGKGGNRGSGGKAAEQVKSGGGGSVVGSDVAETLGQIRSVDILSRIAPTNSYKAMKAKTRVSLSAPGESREAAAAAAVAAVAAGSVVGADGAPFDGGDMSTPGAPLPHLVKGRSDIRSYMMENEGEVDMTPLAKDSNGRLYDNNGVPIPAGMIAAATVAADTGAAAGGGGAAGISGGVGSPHLTHPTPVLMRNSGLTSAVAAAVAASAGLDTLASDAPSGAGGNTALLSSATPLVQLTGSMAVSTLKEVLRQGWRRCDGPGSARSAGSLGEAGSESGGTGMEPLLAFRGMRVRMGIHTGADLSEVSLNKATGRTQYSGTFMTVAKEVCDAAHGGQVVASPATFKRLPPGCLAKSAYLLHMGEHVLSSEEGELPKAMYQLLPYKLSSRLPYFDPLRTHAYLSLGLPDAPVGRVTVAFMYVIGAQTLLAWNPVVAGEALDIFHGTVSEELYGTDGYVVELVDGLCLAAFASPAEALLWSLRCHRRLLTAPWSDELLEHELCEEVSLLLHTEYSTGPASTTSDPPSASGHGPTRMQPSLRPQPISPSPSMTSATNAGVGVGGGGGSVTANGPSGTGPNQPLQQQRCFTLPRATAIRHKTLMRGLRLKVGMDTGFVADGINATTGRMAYRGRPMNRAARIASKALAGQVHCSGAVWNAAVERLGMLARSAGADEVTASSLGLHSLKGVMEKIEVFSVSYKSSTLSAEEAAVVARRAARQSHSSIGSTNLGGLGSAVSMGATATSGLAASGGLPPAGPVASSSGRMAQGISVLTRYSSSGMGGGIRALSPPERASPSTSPNIVFGPRRQLTPPGLSVSRVGSGVGSGEHAFWGRGGGAGALGGGGGGGMGGVEESQELSLTATGGVRRQGSQLSTDGAGEDVDCLLPPSPTTHSPFAGPVGLDATAAFGSTVAATAAGASMYGTSPGGLPDGMAAMARGDDVDGSARSGDMMQPVPASHVVVLMKPLHDAVSEISTPPLDDSASDGRFSPAPDAPPALLYHDAARTESPQPRPSVALAANPSPFGIQAGSIAAAITAPDPFSQRAGSSGPEFGGAEHSAPDQKTPEAAILAELPSFDPKSLPALRGNSKIGGQMGIGGGDNKSLSSHGGGGGGQVGPPSPTPASPFSGLPSPESNDGQRGLPAGGSGSQDGPCGGLLPLPPAPVQPAWDLPRRSTLSGSE